MSCAIFSNPFPQKGTGSGPQNIQIYVCPSNDSSCNREKKLLRHVAMVAKFPDDKNSKKSLKQWICTVSNFVDFFNLSNVDKIFWVKSERSVSRLKKNLKLNCIVAVVLIIIS